MGHPLVYEYGIGCPVQHLYYQWYTTTITFESEAGTTGTEVPRHTQHVHAVQISEGITRIKNYKCTIFF